MNASNLCSDSLCAQLQISQQCRRLRKLDRETVHNRCEGRKRTEKLVCGHRGPCGGNSVCQRATQRSSWNQIPQCITVNSEALPPVGSSEPPEFFGHRLQTSMTRAIVETSTEGLGQTMSSCWWVILPWRPGGIQAQGMRRRPMQAWIAFSGSRTTACNPHALGGTRCGEQRGPDLEHGGFRCMDREKTAKPIASNSTFSANAATRDLP